MIPKPLQPQPLRWIARPLGVFELVATRALVNFEPGDVVAQVFRDDGQPRCTLTTNGRGYFFEHSGPSLGMLQEAGQLVRNLHRPTGGLSPAKAL